MLIDSSYHCLLQIQKNNMQFMCEYAFMENFQSNVIHNRKHTNIHTFILHIDGFLTREDCTGEQEYVCKEHIMSLAMAF